MIARNKMNRRKTGFFVCWVMTILLMSLSGGTAISQLSPEQTLRQWRISDLQLSPDGERIAMSVAEPVKGTEHVSHILIFNLRSRKIKQFTAGKKSERRPRWSPDGRMLAFLTNRDKTTQLFFIPVDGGEAEAFTKSKTAIQSFEWSPNGSVIAFLSTDAKTEAEKQRLKEKDNAFVVDKDVREARLRIISVDSGKVKTLTPEKWRISEYLWHPDGRRLLISATNHPNRDLVTNRLYLLDTTDGKMTEIATPAGPFRDLKISPDGTILAYLGARSKDGPDPHDLFIRPLTGGTTKNLTGNSIDRPVDSYFRNKDGSFTVLAETGFNSTFFKVFPNGKMKKMKEFAVQPYRSFISDGKKMLAFVGGSAIKMPELYLAKFGGKAIPISHFHAGWDTIPLIEPELLHYPSFDGLQIEAALYKPAGFTKGSGAPFVVLVHGGPTGRFSRRFYSWAQLLVSRGYVVLCPNVRGSTGYGHDFMTVNRYDWGGGDWQDVLAGVDYAIQQGWANPDRLGIGGWSYGGYMAAWAVTQTNRFKAAVSGAPMTDLASEFGTESHGVNVGDTWALGTPYENLDLFIKRSPVTFVKNVKTPTLLLNGEKDTTDPIGQCQQFYRGLMRYNVETEFVKYPGMGHGPRTEKHQLDVMKRMLAWFDKYLR